MKDNTVHVDMDSGKMSKEGQSDAMWSSSPTNPSRCSESADPPASNSTQPDGAGSVQGASVSFHDIYYTIQVGEPGKCCSKVSKHIIKGVR